MNNRIGEDLYKSTAAAAQYVEENAAEMSEGLQREATKWLSQLERKIIENPTMALGIAAGSWIGSGDAAETTMMSNPDSRLPGIDTSLSIDGLPVSPPEEAEVVIPDTPVQAVTEELGGVATDTAKLLELQLALFESECSQSARRLIQPIWIFLAGTACGTASLMMLFHAVGWALHDLFNWPVSVSLFIVTVVGAALTGFALKIAAAKMKEPRISFEKSKATLMQNIRCYASLLQGSEK